MQQHVEATIRKNIYPSFLCSEMYILYIQQMSAAHERFSSGGTVSASGSSSGTSCAGGGGGSNGSSGGQHGGGDTQMLATAVGAIGGMPMPPFVCNTFTSHTSKLTSISTSTVASASTPLINLPSSSSVCGVSSGGAPPAGTCSASGSVYGPSTSASSSGSVSATDTLPRSSTLPTLHEDSELSLCDDFEKLRVEGGRMSADMPMRLTRDLLLATQKRRLEIRPPG